MTVKEFCDWMQKEIETNPDIANYDLVAGTELGEYIVGTYEVEISHIKKEVIL